MTDDYTVSADASLISSSLESDPGEAPMGRYVELDAYDWEMSGADMYIPEPQKDIRRGTV